jgi:site-specific DNA-methyltransferase (adenine-specific)
MDAMTPYYQDDLVTIHRADALSFLWASDDESIDVVFTDPPYSSGARQSAQMRARGSMRREEGKFGKDQWFGSDNLTAHGFAMMIRLFAAETYRVTKRDGHLFCFIDWQQLPVIQGVIASAGWSPRALLVWDKMSFGMGNGFRQQAEFVLHCSKGTGDNFARHDVGTVTREARPADDLYPTEKPVAPIELWLSAVPGSVVLDPFCGSGPTLAAAKNLGRRAIGVDISRKACAVAAERCRQEVLALGAA